MVNSCSHCGVRLLFGSEVFCGECRRIFNKPPARRDEATSETTETIPTVAQIESDRGKAARAAIVTSISFYAIMIFNLFAPKIQSKAKEAFGLKPLGLPAVVFAGLLKPSSPCRCRERFITSL